MLCGPVWWVPSEMHTPCGCCVDVNIDDRMKVTVIDPESRGGRQAFTYKRVNNAGIPEGASLIGNNPAIKAVSKDSSASEEEREWGFFEKFFRYGTIIIRIVESAGNLPVHGMTPMK